MSMYWRIWVPNFYNPKPTDNCLELSFDKEAAKKILLDTLEEFICNGNPQAILKQLKQMDNPPSVCGRFFKPGEPTYICKECGIDSTCLMCIDCFKQSAHVCHKYKMGISEGGGCCDCGDIEAWKSEPFCKIHLAGAECKESSENKLPKDIVERLVITFKAVFKYCYRSLSSEHLASTPSDFTLKKKDEDCELELAENNIYCVVLFNDETHGFEQVLIMLIAVMKDSFGDSCRFVTKIDAEGRAIVKCAEFSYCNELK